MNHHPWLPADFMGFIGAVIVSVISGIISITRRITLGEPASFLWITSEFLTAILCGYLMFTAYPHIEASLPSWFTLPVAVALAAHVGGRIFQEVESHLINTIGSRIKR